MTYSDTKQLHDLGTPLRYVQFLKAYAATYKSARGGRRHFPIHLHTWVFDISTSLQV